MIKHFSKILILTSFILSFVGVLFIFKTNQKSVPISKQPSYAPPVAVAESPKLTEIISPDGKDTLTVKEEKTKENIVYTFTTSKQKFTRTVPIGNSISAETHISVPFNTFSPDDKYIFLKEGNDYLVPLKDEVVNINALFAEKYPDLTISEITGWGGMTLLVVNTENSSFWFDVTSKSFIQLSTRFN